MSKQASFLGLWTVLVGLIAGGCGEPYLLTAEDVVCPADEETTLVGKIEKRGIFVLNEGLVDQDVEFFLNDEFLGLGRSDEDGYVKIVCPARQAGITGVRVVYGEGTDESVEVTAKIFTWASDEPILVVDIDDTLCQTRLGVLIGISYDDYSEPFPGSAAAMQELAKSFKIIYLTVRPRELIAKTKRWLENNGFPEGPLLTWDIDSDPWSQLGYKELRLDRLTEKFNRIMIGVGNTEKDYTAYRNHAMFSIFIDPKSQSKQIDRGVKLSDWTKVSELFLKNPQLFDLKSPDGPIKLP